MMIVVVVVVVEGGSGGGGDGGGDGRRAPDGRQDYQPSRPARSQPSIPITWSLGLAAPRPAFPAATNPSYEHNNLPEAAILWHAGLKRGLGCVKLNYKPAWRRHAVITSTNTGLSRINSVLIFRVQPHPVRVASAGYIMQGLGTHADP